VDILQRVRELGKANEIGDEAIIRARRELAEAIHSRRRPRRPVFVIVIAAGAAAVLTTAGLLASQMFTPARSPIAVQTSTPERSPVATPWTPAPSTAEPLTARVMLASVAKTVLAGKATTPAPGQYLRVERKVENLVLHNSVDGISESFDRDHADAAWVARWTTTTYAPADLHGEWARIGGGDLDVGPVYGEAASVRAGLWMDRQKSMFSETEILPGGPNDNWPDSSGATLAEYLGRMPTDSTQLLDWLKAQVGDSELAQQKVGLVVVNLLSYNVGSPAQRSALYGALSELPGAEILEHDDEHATVVFTSVVALPSGAPRTLRYSVGFDLRTGAVTEQSEWTSGSSVLVPDAVPDVHITYSLSVVDSIP